MTRVDLDRAALELLLEMAPRLREAGVLSVGLPDLQATLAPAIPRMPELVVIDKRAAAPEPVDPLDDPETFGLPRGTRLPWGEPRPPTDGDS